MRKYFFVLAMAVGATAMAEARADVQGPQADPQIIVNLSKQADAGNPEAQLRLGKVYWYGKGVPVDRAKADALFAQAAAAGNKEAASAVRLSAARAQHAADIEYWTSKYDGADLVTGQFNCQPPTLPTMSRNNRAIKSVETSVANWKQCYNGFVNNINDAMPSGKRIPGEVAELMTDAEMAQARAHLDRVYARVAGDAQASADKTLAAYEKWSRTTAAYVAQSNDESEAREHDLGLMRDHAQRGASPPKRQ